MAVNETWKKAFELIKTLTGNVDTTKGTLQTQVNDLNQNLVDIVHVTEVTTETVDVPYADADKLGGQLPAYYATKASVDTVNENLGNKAPINAPYEWNQNITDANDFIKGLAYNFNNSIANCPYKDGTLLTTQATNNENIVYQTFIADGAIGCYFRNCVNKIANPWQKLVTESDLAIKSIGTIINDGSEQELELPSGWKELILVIGYGDTRCEYVIPKTYTISDKNYIIFRYYGSNTVYSEHTVFYSYTANKFILKGIYYTDGIVTSGIYIWVKCR